MPNRRDVYVRLSSMRVVRTLETAPGINIDVDDHGMPVGVEILGAEDVEINGVAVADTVLTVEDKAPPKPKAGPSCKGYFHLGFLMTVRSCEYCGRPIWEHKGRAELTDDNPFKPMTFREFTEEEIAKYQKLKEDSEQSA